MKEYLLTFEIESDGKELVIHGDSAGLDFFANQILTLAKKVKDGERDHDHFMTSEWGGIELSSDTQSEKGTLVHHVKVMGWPEPKE